MNVRWNICKSMPLLRLHTLWLFAAILICVRSAECRAEGEYPIRGTAQIQEQIDQVVQYRGARTNFGKGHLRALAALETLRGFSTVDAPKLVRELLYYHNHASDMRGRMASMKLIDELDISDVAILEGVLPFIGVIGRDYAPDSPMKKLKSEVERLLSHVENGPHIWPQHPDYRAHTALIAAQKEDPPQNLVQYMFRRSPQTALVAFLRIYVHNLDKIKQLAWAQHIVSDAIWRKDRGFLAEFKQIESDAVAQLENLSQHDQWWARLYVAEIVRQHPELGASRLLERLKQDEHNLVREAISRQP